MTTAQHGSRFRYSVGCRCAQCTAANSRYNKEWYRKKRLAEGKVLRPPGGWGIHGTYGKYRMGCRCKPCCEANKLYKRRYNWRAGISKPRVPTPLLRAQVACLTSFGIERKRVAEAAGVSYKTAQLKREAVNQATADAISGVHWSLWRHHGPFRRHCRCEIPQEVLEWLEGDLEAS